MVQLRVAPKDFPTNGRICGMDGNNSPPDHTNAIRIDTNVFRVSSSIDCLPIRPVRPFSFRGYDGHAIFVGASCNYGGLIKIDELMIQRKSGIWPRISLAIVVIVLCTSTKSVCQLKPKALIITGNGNVPEVKEAYPPWIHDFQNETVMDILKDEVVIDISEDFRVLHPDRLLEYDLIINNSLFLTPDQEQLDALYRFVSSGKSYLALHCGILSFLNWENYEAFMGGFFVGGPSTEPESFKVFTTNNEFWGYPYAFRAAAEHPVSYVVDDFVTKDELYYFQPSITDFHVIARAENHPVMWWHPVGKGRVMSLTLGHDEEAKRNAGYQQLLVNGVRWLTGIPLIHAVSPKPLSTRELTYADFIPLQAMTGSSGSDAITFGVVQSNRPDLYSLSCSPDGRIDVQLSGKTGTANFAVVAQHHSGLSSKKMVDIHVVQDGVGNIAHYTGNTATCSSSENQSPMFDIHNILDNDLSTRWSSARAETAWVTIDLQKAYPVAKLTLHWEAAHASEYRIQGSLDGGNWQTIADVAQGDGGIDTVLFNPVDARFIRIEGTKRAAERWGYSLYEVEVYQ